MRKTNIGVVVHTSLRDQLFSIEDCARLDSLGHVRWTESAKPITPQEAIRILRESVIGIGSWGTPKPDEPVLHACPHLKLWEHAGGSVKHILGPHLNGRELIVASCAPAIAENAAQTVLGELIIGLKRLIDNVRANRHGVSQRPPNSRNLWNCTIGIIAASEPGLALIRLLKPFGCRILLYDPLITGPQAAALGVQLVPSLVELCSTSDAISLHAPLLPGTTHLLGTREFRAMRDDAIFINTSRGDCIDEQALIAELAKGRLFAFLDVSSAEPAASDSPLRRLPNVFYTSHISNGPDFRIGRQVVDDIEAYLRGGRPKLVVTKDMLDRIA